MWTERHPINTNLPPPQATPAQPSPTPPPLQTLAPSHKTSMQLLELDMGQTLESSSLLDSSSEEMHRSFGSIKPSTPHHTISSPLSTSTAGMMTVGVKGAWGGRPRTNSIGKHYRPSSSATTPTSATSSTTCRFADNNKLLSVFTLIGLILIFSNFTKMPGVAAMPRCPATVVNEEPEDCPYGITTDYCGRKVCAKGPGQICGVGLFKLLGSCGEGLYCNCGRCTGCSLLTMECYDKTCV